MASYRHPLFTIVRGPSSTEILTAMKTSERVVFTVSYVGGADLRLGKIEAEVLSFNPIFTQIGAWNIQAVDHKGNCAHGVYNDLQEHGWFQPLN